ncbi:putative salicylate hydroxylase [Cladorrhinum sp. PSN259]|nr:putative salicylate hydroxylase [Cladorrhinum sp. PSN259]
MSSPTPEVDIALIGAGITSLTLSIGLARIGIKHKIYEQSPHLTELGAGLGFGPNAWRALRLIEPRLLEIFEKVATFTEKTSHSQPTDETPLPTTTNETTEQEDEEQKEEKHPIWIEFLPGTSPLPPRSVPSSFKVHARHSGGKGHAAVHRAKWLDVLASFVTAPIVFRKRFESLTQSESSVTINFSDGSTATHSAVIGCDGVKSKVRTALFPQSKCGYSGKYAYRALIPFEEAVKILGEVRSGVPSLWMGPGAHLLTFPVLDNLNIVAFCTDTDSEWAGTSSSLTVPTTKQDAIDDFKKAGFSDALLGLFNAVPDDRKLNKWGLFDVADNPPPSFFKGRVTLIGDAAHASTPHHGSGAGFCMEDVAVLTGLLEQWQESELGPGRVEDVFAQFDASRRKRDQWLVQSSRRAAELYQFQVEGITSLEDIKRDIEERQEVCWGFDVERAVEETKNGLKERLDANL